MTYEINETHDPNLRSWVESANDPNTDFPIQNLPFCEYKERSYDGPFSSGIVVGDQILNWSKCAHLGLIPKPVGAWSREPSDFYSTINEFRKSMIRFLSEE